MNNINSNIEKNGDLNPDTDFEISYIALRQRENRIYTDAQVLLFPNIASDHLHFTEWQIRKQSCLRLITYLKKKNKAFKILEIGCGNGWFSAKLSKLTHSEVIGLDINHSEISQAINVFKRDNLKFLHNSFPCEALTGVKFDIILFAASVQYFSSFQATINQAMKHLNEGGEIHITDTFFYKPEEISKAVQRCQSYYFNLGCPDMARHYFHHSTNDFKIFNHRVLASPNHLFNRIRKRNPFYWINIKP